MKLIRYTIGQPISDNPIWCSSIGVSEIGIGHDWDSLVEIICYLSDEKSIRGNRPEGSSGH
jgi:hypothetical protein